MDVQRLSSAARAMRRALVLLVIVVLVMIASNLFLATKLVSQSNQVVLVPTMVRDGMVARGTVDKGYVEALALDAVYAMYNAAPGSLDYGRQTIERLSSPADRARILARYDEIAEDMRERDISTVFYPRRIEHNFRAYEIVVSGELVTFLETTQVAREAKRILLEFRPQAGSIRLVSIGALVEAANG
ncbi:type IV conjugative transfer system protein TraE [Chachezhania sediminis]|uniref:type IV conjugative transfer system protein TraE n=1 Tax=Chachezhania sediminis TaxID=2599291 RepID=UPI001E58FE0C|nr:type IV conjugative transfer system protein TraE [Chachezhania sediminis]